MTQAFSNQASLRPLRRGEVKVGRPLTWSLHDRCGTLLLQRGRVIENIGQLETLLERGCLVAETCADAVETPRMAPHPTLPGTPSPFEAMDRLRQEIGLLHRQLLAGTAEGVPERVARLAADIDHALAHDADATLATMQLQLDPGDHAARQAHAAILCVFAARTLRLDDNTMRGLAGAALTYDVALGSIIAQLNAQREGLGAGQSQEVRAHPEAGLRLLEAAGVSDPIWLDAVLHHHERLDGSGYPHGLHGGDIPLPTRLLAIIDIYTAMLRPRTYREALPARMILRRIFLERGQRVDDALATALIKELGVYPPGTLVRLANGEVGIVLRRGDDATHPLVARLMTAEGYRAGMAVARDTRAEEFQIVDSVSHDRYPGLAANAAALWK